MCMCVTVLSVILKVLVRFHGLHWLVTNIFINVLIAYFRGQDSYSQVDNHNCDLFNDLQTIIFSKCKITYLNKVLLSLQQSSLNSLYRSNASVFTRDRTRIFVNKLENDKEMRLSAALKSPTERGV